MKKSLLKTTLSIAAMLAIAACSNKPTHVETARANADTTQATAISGGSDYTVIEFKKGSDQLTESSREAIRHLSAESARHDRAIDEVKVLAWADREYPADSTKATKREKELAERRAEEIKKYIKDDLRLSADVDNHNMAKRPGVFSELIQTDDYKIKTNFEETGAAPTTVTGQKKAILGSKVSKAVIFVKYK